jgi:type VI secretion system protein ImpC
VADATTLDLRRFLSSMSFSAQSAAPPRPMIENNLQKVTEDVSAEDRFLSGLGALVYNVDPIDGKLSRAKTQDLILRIDRIVNAQLNEILHNEKFQALEAAWRGIDDLVQHTNFRANITIDVIDVSKEELQEDFENNSVDVTGAALFKKIYVLEFDQYGGKPFGSIVGLYQFSNTPKELFWLRQMGKIAALSHAPFISAVSPRFFGCHTTEELAAIKDLTGLLRQPSYGAWDALRESPEAAYLALTLPRYLLREPWHPEHHPSGDLAFEEDTSKGDDSHYLWGNASILLARNLARSFEHSGWCQHIRGPKGGGLVDNLTGHRFRVRDDVELKVPVELVLPDFSELEYANAGFIPLIYRRSTRDACFFSCQSLKVPKKFKDNKDSENAQLATNLSYTLSITRIAHYLKCIVRDVIGTTAEGHHVRSKIQNWLNAYVTTVIKPDDVTLAYYPFKAATVEIKKSEGLVGKYTCSVAVLPHIQFEGIDVELRLESRVG